mgnify:CR=1 FL=1|tara:strand:- start:2537 stop:3124 length:588 start_codon:yes stop_codon:yes gene_type:complete
MADDFDRLIGVLDRLSDDRVAVAKELMLVRADAIARDARLDAIEQTQATLLKNQEKAKKARAVVVDYVRKRMESEKEAEAQAPIVALEARLNALEGAEKPATERIEARLHLPAGFLSEKWLLRAAILVGALLKLGSMIATGQPPEDFEIEGLDEALDVGVIPSLDAMPVIDVIPMIPSIDAAKPDSDTDTPEDPE